MTPTDPLDRLKALGRETEKTAIAIHWAETPLGDGGSTDHLRRLVTAADERMTAALDERIASDLAGWERVRELEEENERLEQDRLLDMDQGYYQKLEWMLDTLLREHHDRMGRRAGYADIFALVKKDLSDDYDLLKDGDHE